MRPPINYARLAEIDERDKQVREETRGAAMIKATLSMTRYTLPAPGEFFLEQIKAMRTT